ncbi:MAG TPA: hypothetical protein VGK61_08525 [Planctomycetota bacterium]
MGHGSADIESAEVVKEFRNRLVAFDRLCRNALIGVDAEVKRTVDWLRSTQLPACQRQVRKDEEAVNRAMSEYLDAGWRSSYTGKTSRVEEMKALHRAKRRKEESEAKLAAVRRWATVLDQTIGKMSAPCNALGILIDHLTPRALARLDQMLDNLEEYFRAKPQEST